MFFLIVVVIAVYVFIGVYKLTGIEIEKLDRIEEPKSFIVFLLFWPFIKVD